MQAVIAILAALVQRGATGEGAYLDVSVADGVVALMSLYVDEYFATGEVPGPGPQHPHRPVRLLRRVPLRRRPLGRGRRDRAALLREPVPRARLRAVARAPDRRRGAGRRSAPTSAPRSRTRTRDEWVAELGPADTCVSEVATVPELVHDAHFRGARRVRRRATRAEHGDFEQVGWVLAGMDRGQPGPTVRDATDHRHRRAARRGRLLRGRDRRATRGRSGGVSDNQHGARRDRGADRQGAVRGDGRVPRRAGLHLDVVRVGRERQPALLGRRGRRRDHRRADRAADDDLGVVPSAPLGARSHEAGAAAAGALRPEGEASTCPKRS